MDKQVEIQMQAEDKKTYEAMVEKAKPIKNYWEAIAREEFPRNEDITAMEDMLQKWIEGKGNDENKDEMFLDTCFPLEIMFNEKGDLCFDEDKAEEYRTYWTKWSIAWDTIFAILNKKDKECNNLLRQIKKKAIYRGELFRTIPMRNGNPDYKEGDFPEQSDYCSWSKSLSGMLDICIGDGYILHSTTEFYNDTFAVDLYGLIDILYKNKLITSKINENTRGEKEVIFPCRSDMCIFSKILYNGVDE